MLGETVIPEHDQRAACRELEEVGEKTGYSSVAALLARTLYAQGRYAEAEHYTVASEEASGPNDVLSNILWRSTRAKVLAHVGELEGAERLAREAVSFAAESDFLNTHADALTDLDEVLRLAGKSEGAAPALERALALHERKSNLAMGERTRASVQALRVPAPGSS